MTLPFSRDILAKHTRPVAPVAIPLSIFIVFVTWYFWISLSCPVGSAVPTRFCGTGHARAGLLAPSDASRVGKVDNDNKSDVVNGKEPEVVEYQDSTGPGNIDSQTLPSDLWFREQASDISVLTEKIEFGDNGMNESVINADFQNSEASPGTSGGETSSDLDQNVNFCSLAIGAIEEQRTRSYQMRKFVSLCSFVLADYDRYSSGSGDIAAVTALLLRMVIILTDPNGTKASNFSNLGSLK